MSDIKHKIFVGYDLPSDIDGPITVPPAVPFTFDSSLISFDSTVRTFDETT